jgi:mersacidin/lichenicidin family type 2 lantibiotic
MSNLDVVRAWKDEEYRLALSGPQLAELPVNPAGLIELADPNFDQFPITTTLCTCALCETITMQSCITICPTAVADGLIN